MANPAELLHKQLMSWANRGQATASTSRGLANSKAENEIWKQHRRCSTYLDEIEQCLELAKEQGHDISVYEKYFNTWTRELWVYSSGWNSSTATITNTPMEHLRNLGTLLNLVVPTFKDEVHRSGFEDFLQVAVSHIQGLPQEHDHLKKHALRVLRHIQGCMDDIDVLGEFNLLNALHDLQWILDDLKSAVPRDPFFKRAASGVWFYFKKSAVVALPAAAIAVSQGALGSAGEDFYDLVKEEVLALESAAKEEPSSDDSKCSSPDTTNKDAEQSEGFGQSPDQ